MQQNIPYVILKNEIIAICTKSLKKQFGGNFEKMVIERF